MAATMTLSTLTTSRAAPVVAVGAAARRVVGGVGGSGCGSVGRSAASGGVVARFISANSSSDAAAAALEDTSPSGRSSGSSSSSSGRRGFGISAAAAAAAAFLVSTSVAPAPAFAATVAAQQAYEGITMALVNSTNDLVNGKSSDVAGWLTQASAWNETKSMYSPKTQGRSFLMVTKLIAYLKNSFATLDSLSDFNPADPPYNAEKTKEWLGFAQGFTDGTLSGQESRDAFAKATWGNYDKSAKLNRIGLCAFGDTPGTKYLGVNCDGY